MKLRNILEKPNDIPVNVMNPDRHLNAFSMFKSAVSNINEQIDSEIISFFTTNDNPTTKEIETLANKLDIDKSDVEERIYSILCSMLTKIGKHNDEPDETFNEQQLKTGVQVELEHTHDELIAKLIAKDHLSEIPDYYTRLDKMEDEAGAE